MASSRAASDSMGDICIPADVHYGAQTQRAVENFRISGIRFPRQFIRSLGLIKAAAAEVNGRLNLLTREVATAIHAAANEVAAGHWDDEFVLDVFQTGSGTSTNMNANEVIASRANELIGGVKGDVKPIRPIEDVNRCQSSNDVIPTAIHLAALAGIDHELLPAIEQLAMGLESKALEFHDILKTGRTHLQDAVPIMLGQEFSGWASQLRHAIARIQSARAHLLELPIGGTALGTGLNAHPEFGVRIITVLVRTANPDVRTADNLFEAIGSRDALVEASGALKSLAVSLIKIAGDIRLLASGPRTGFGEISLPELQPGSSLMPGKVNPVMPEMMIQVCAQVIGNDAAVTLGGLLGQLELNAMMPLMAHNILQSISILAASCRTFNDRCVSHGPAIIDRPDNINGITANRERCQLLVESSLMSVTALVPVIGYQKSAEIAHESWRTGKSIRQVAMEQHLVPDSILESALDLTSMTGNLSVCDNNVLSHEMRYGNTCLHGRWNQSKAIDRWRDDGGLQ